MCGITAIFDTVAQRTVDESLLEAMTTVISHRGPDGSGFHLEPGVGLGHRRLAIIDLAGGDQPIYNEDGTVAVVFNGEIYNFLELIPQLVAKGHKFRTRCDTEVIVHAWEEWGEACLEHFNGMFAFVLWDSRQQALFLARDRLGKKPLYYSISPDGWLYVGSELKALMLIPGLDRSLDQHAVEDYFAYGYVPDPKCILHSVRKLPPAHSMVISRGQPARTRRYWEISPVIEPGRSEAEVQEELRRRLKDCVAARLIADVPLGAFLSGGVDSSAVVATMAGLSQEPVKTCSISFGDPRFNESQYAAKLARRYATDHHVEQVDIDDFDLLDQLAGVYDEPFADSSAIPTYRVCQLARRQVTVALSGDGGDEVFGGYRRYRWHVYEERVRSRLPAGIRRPLFGLLGRMYPKLDWAPRFLRAKSTLEALARDSVEGYLHSVSILTDALRSEMFSADFRASLGAYRAIEVLRLHADKAPLRDPLSLVQYLDFHTYLPGDILVKVDRAAMAHSLEVRVPMLDYRLVDWAAGLAPGLKLRNGEGKYVFKKSLEALVPKELLYRDKMGFAVPIASWFRGPLSDRVASLSSDSGLRECGIFDVRTISRLSMEHRAGYRDHSAVLWALMMFESFQRNIRSQRLHRNR